MTGFTFFIKELKEIIKTQKIFIIPSIFLLVAFSSPLSAKYINEILKMAGGNINIVLPEPKFTDSYAQFFKNFNSMCLFVMVLSFMGVIVDERVRGSMILVLTKRVSRTQFIVSKFTAAVTFYTLSFIVSVGACVYYTYLLFPTFYHENLWVSFLIFWLYGVFIISITVFASTITKTHMMAGVIGIIGLLAIPLIAFIPKIGKYTPGKLSELSTNILLGVNQASEALIPFIVTAALVIVLIILSVVTFKRQEI
ncbi:ABC transporter permease [Acetivibrio cellulolyticus]|uniref:ABC transporter permease n=1 Tax=Acetivibrio cellulolyticus TaxID=35830 RepID=UPI0001E2EB71|nr:ABC transporter permease [Acetivibrio cellulolyticus]